MKKRLTILILCIITAGFVFCWMFIRQEKQSSGLQTISSQDPDLANMGDAQISNHSAALGSDLEPTPESNPAAWIEKRLKQRAEDVEKGKDEWRTPIEFYGKIVDEQEQPVEGVQVKFSCNDLSAEGTSYYEKISDNQGLFSISGVQGKLLTAKVSKAGYYTSVRDNDSFYYAGQNVNFVPNPNQPVLFHLRKHGPGEHLIGFSKNFRVPKDGSPILLDLISNTLVPSTETGIKIECWTENPAKRGARFNWKCRISIPSGGLQSNDDEFGFLAPADGYQESDEIDMTLATAEKWQRDIARQYFIRTANGRYGRLTFRMIAGGDHFCVIDSVLNPSGSRNLEPSHAVQPKQTQFE